MTRRPHRNHTPAFKAKVAPAAVIDWFSRRVLAWRLAISMDVSFCIEAAEEALAVDQV